MSPATLPRVSKGLVCAAVCCGVPVNSESSPDHDRPRQHTADPQTMTHPSPATVRAPAGMSRPPLSSALPCEPESGCSRAGAGVALPGAPLGALLENVFAAFDRVDAALGECSATVADLLSTTALLALPEPTNEG